MKKCEYCGEEINEGIRKRFHNKCIKKRWNKANKDWAKSYYLKNKKEIDKKNREYALENKEKVRRYKIKWLQENHKKAKECALKYASKHKEESKLKQRIVRKTEKKKVSARNRVARIKKSESCNICGSKINLEKHHWDYNKPLKINTLCRVCHNIQHIKNFKQSAYGGSMLVR